ncbi:MAG TPA: type IV pilus twitching motility protein PilT [Rickettsiales bacterium]|nr:type IV pilus twitching motility protein PilT [Rickettsiales bacterium]
MEITDLLFASQKNNASDLHLSVGNPPILRVNGDMLPLKMPPMTQEEVRHIIYSIMTEQQRSDYERDLEVDFALSYSENMRFRINAFNTLAGPAAVLRTIPTRIYSIEELNAPEILKKMCELHKGLVLVTGPTGSGKSTTLAAMINHINQSEAKHILTIEDPVEFIHTSKKSLINQREIGASTKSFAKALRSALREDPDVILVGELRDLETIQLAMTAAETGHLVFGTLHTNSAPKTVDRIIDVFPAGEKEMVRAMLSVSLEAVITQALVKRADGTGRVAVHEILLGTPAIRNLIRENKVPQITSMMQVGSKAGMRTMKDAAYQLLNDGVISPETAKGLLATAGNAEGDALPGAAASGGNDPFGGRPAASPRNSKFNESF